MAETRQQAIPILAPNGKTYMVPPDEVAEAILRGGQHVVRMAAPDGKQRWIPLDQAEEGIKRGGTVVRQDGRPYTPGQAPIIVGRNSAGQPIWGNAPEPAKRGFLGSAKDAIENTAKGSLEFFDPRPTEEEKQSGRTTLLDNIYPLTLAERMVAPQVNEAARAAEEFKAAHDAKSNRDATMHGMAAAGHGLATVVPGLGPVAANVGEQAGTQAGEGDLAGAAGTVLGNAAGAFAPEIGLKGLKATRAWAKGKIAAAQAPEAVIDRPIAPGEMTPRERFKAAQDMGVNLDRAQATTGMVPNALKRPTEHGLTGSPVFEENNAANVQALHEHVGNIINDASAQPMTKEEFGNHVKAKLSAHRASLVDEPGQRAQAQQLLDSADPRSMSREEFGDAAREALEHHRLMTEEKINGLYHDLDSRLGDLHPDTKGVQEKAKAIYSQNKRFYENHPDLLKGADARAWAIIKDFAGVDDKIGAEKPVDTWADLQRARSHLLDLTRGPEFLGELSTGWIKQMTGAIDDAMTSAENTPGLKAKDVQQFRQANALYKGLKDTIDNTQSPFYWASRQEGMKVADRLNNLGPEDARRFREIINQTDRPDLVGQQQRQFIHRILDPAGNGVHDLAGLKNRWEKLPKEQTESLLDPGQMKGLSDLAEKSATETPYDTAHPNLAAVIKAEDGTKAHQAMFEPSNGRLKLTPAEIRQIEQVDPDMAAQLRRQAISHLFDPTESGNFDLKNFSSRWNRTQAAPLQALLTPEQLSDLDDVAGVSKVVNWDRNPSGSGKVAQQAAEAAGVVSGLPTSLATAFSGHPVAAAGAALATPAWLGAQRIIANRLVDPKLTEEIMTAPRPSAGQAVGDAFAGGLSPSAAGGTAAVGNAGNEPSAEQRWKQLNADRMPQPAPAAPPGTVQPPLKTEPQTPGAGSVAPASPVQPALKPPIPPGQGSAMGDAARLSATNAQISQALDNPPAPPASPPAPDGATHEVIHQDGKTVLGHMVKGQYVPLE